MNNEPNGLLLAHRAMLRDLDRLAELTATLAGGAARLHRKRAAAIAAYLSDFCDSIHHHHSAEDEVLWPVLERSAGAHVDLTELTDDHAVLDPKLARIWMSSACTTHLRVRLGRRPGRGRWKATCGRNCSSRR